ncbi:MAG TPA: S1 RNA-binding domain-containing protein, partial [Nitrospirota bacterium]|nr:S1 RNA-binding domain-containing protein [Nitrospirota bacterium]
MKDTREDNDQEENGAPGGEDQNEFEKLYDQSLKSFKSGTVVRGRVLQVRTGVSGVVMLDLGYKSDGIIPAEQFTEEELKALKPGDELEVLLEAAEDANGNLLLSREKAKKMQVWDVLNRAYQTGEPLQGRVLSVIKVGLTVDIGGVTAFLPGSQIDIKPVHNLNQMVGQVLELKI